MSQWQKQDQTPYIANGPSGSDPVDPPPSAINGITFVGTSVRNGTLTFATAGQYRVTVSETNQFLGQIMDTGFNNDNSYNPQIFCDVGVFGSGVNNVDYCRVSCSPVWTSNEAFANDGSDLGTVTVTAGQTKLIQFTSVIPDAPSDIPNALAHFYVTVNIWPTIV